MKTAIINQPAGVGDIFFCQKIAAKLRDAGYNIIWPVIPEFVWVKDYIDHAEFVSTHDDFKYKNLYNRTDHSVTYFTPDESLDTTVVNLCSADRRYASLNMSVMHAKYQAVNLTYSNWADFFNFKRNKQKEEQLFYDILGLKDNSIFAFKNANFASPPHMQTCSAVIEAKIPDMQTVMMSTIEGFTLIDWCMVLEKASAIHTVETSLNYIIEKLNTTNTLFMYSKWKPANFFHIKNLFNKPWIYE